MENIRLQSAVAALLLMLVVTEGAWHEMAVASEASEKPILIEPANDVKVIEDPAPQAEELLKKMNITQKVAMVTGVPLSANNTCIGYIIPMPEIGFDTGLCIRDGGQSVHMSVAGAPVTDLVSAFPSGIALAATWDREIVHNASIALADEFKGKGSHVMNAPVLGGPIGRSAFNGRIYENYGDDPVLVGEFASVIIKAVHSRGVQTCVKHFMGYEQETNRGAGYMFLQNIGVPLPIDSIIDDRATHEVYTWGFAEAIHAGTTAFMSSYNRYNGSFASQNPALKKLLKDEFNFQGYVMSDWASVWSTAPAINNGLDMNMPGNDKKWAAVVAGVPEPILPGESQWGSELEMAIANREVNESRLDDAILRILTPYYRLNQPSVIPNASSNETINSDVTGGHDKVIRAAGAAAATLLKNTAGAGLPLAAGATVAVFGDDAGHPTGHFADATNGTNCASLEQCTHVNESIPEDQIVNGTMYSGGSSGSAVSLNIAFPIDALVDYVNSSSGTILANLTKTIYRYPDLIASFAEQTDTALVFIQLRATEGSDLPTLHADANGDAIVQAVAKQFNNTIVVIHSANPIVVADWIDHPNVTAVVDAFAPGGQAGPAIVDVLYGDVNPSGRLPFTLPKSEADCIPPVTSFENGNPTSYFNESLLLDYRRFDAEGIEPQFPFGFGLSYTTFDYSNLTVNSNVSSGAAAVSSDPTLHYQAATVSVDVKNTGNRTGSDVVQVYMKYPENAGEPPKVLRGFEKVRDIAPGETKTANISLIQKSFSIWDVVSQQWTVPSGDYVVSAAANSRDLRLNQTLSL